MKTVEDFFHDWESHVFGRGYGTGEPFVLGALHSFLQVCNLNDLGTGYDYRVLEERLNPVVAWLLINTLCHADILDYGSSPRYGWLAPPGIALRDFCARKTVDELIEIAGRHSDEYHDIVCYPDYCNCDDGDCRKLNPFWPRRS